MSKREKVLEVMAKHPSWSVPLVAKKAKCSPSYAHLLRKQVKETEYNAAKAELEAESTAAVTSVSVPATGLSAEVKRSYLETNDLPPAPVEVVTRSRFLVPPNRISRGIDKQTTVMQRITSRGSLGTGHCIRVLR